MPSLPQHIPFLESESTRMGRATLSLADETVSPPTLPFPKSLCMCINTAASVIVPAFACLTPNTQKRRGGLSRSLIHYLPRSVCSHVGEQFLKDWFFFILFLFPVFRHYIAIAIIAHRYKYCMIHCLYLVVYKYLQSQLLFQTQSYVKPQYIKLIKENFVSIMCVRFQCVMLTYEIKKKEQWGFVMNTEIWNQCYGWQLQSSLTSVSNLFPFVVGFLF